MELDWATKAVEEFLELEDEVQQKILKAIEKLPEKGLEWEKIELIDRPKINFNCYRIKIDPDKPNINHRVLFKVREKSYMVLKIGVRPEFYSLDNLKEAQNRLKQ